MHLNTTASLPRAKAPGKALILHHRLEPVAKTQARLRGRMALTPEIVLKDYRFQAVIDWIEFRMGFTRRVQVQNLQPVFQRIYGRNAHIEPEDKAPGAVFTRCSIKIQEPESLARVFATHQALVAAFGEVEPARITGIEISLDAYPRTPSDTARGLLLGVMQRTLWTDRDIWTRSESRIRYSFGRKADETRKIPPEPDKDMRGDRRLDPERYEIPTIDSTLYLGARDDDVMIRVMDKVIDRQRPDGTRETLTGARKRVRVEVAIRGDAVAELGLTDMASLHNVQFASLQKRFFQFKLPTFSFRRPATRSADVARNWEENLRLRTYLRAGNMALMFREMTREERRRRQRRPVRRTLKQMGLPVRPRAERLAAPFVAYQALNREISSALGRLDKRGKTALERSNRPV